MQTSAAAAAAVLLLRGQICFVESGKKRSRVEEVGRFKMQGLVKKKVVNPTIHFKVTFHFFVFALAAAEFCVLFAF